MPRRFVDTIAIMSAKYVYLYVALNQSFSMTLEHSNIEERIKNFIVHYYEKYNEAQPENPTAKILASLKWAIDKRKISVYYFIKMKKA